MQKFLGRRDRGSLNLELALIIMLLALAVVSTIRFLGYSTNNKFNNTSQRLSISGGTIFAGYTVVPVQNSNGTYVLNWPDGVGPYKVQISTDQVVWNDITTGITKNSTTITPAVGNNYYKIVDSTTASTAAFSIVGPIKWARGGISTFQTSYDGNSWITNASAQTMLGNKCYGIFKNANLWVAVGGGDRIITSSDGVTWADRGSSITFDADSYVMDVSYNGYIWVAVVNSNGGIGDPAILTSPDGITWTTRLTSSAGAPLFGNDLHFNSVEWNGAYWLAMGILPNSLEYTSPDGITWTPRDTGVATMVVNDLAWNGNMWVAAVGDSTTGATVYTSSDAVTWTSRGNPFGGNPNVPGNAETLGKSVLWNGSMWVMIAQGGQDPFWSTHTIATSVDGITWTGHGRVMFDNGHDLLWTGTQWIAIGDSNTVATSSDGTNWAKTNPVATSALVIAPASHLYTADYWTTPVGIKY